MRPSQYVVSTLLLGASILAVDAVEGTAANAPTASPTAKASSKPASAPDMVLPFIQDDYAKALQEARERKQPLFIEAWAPW